MGQRASYDQPGHMPRPRSENERAILTTEFSELFVDAMRDRMIVGSMKYGPLADGVPEKVDVLRSLDDRIRKYVETGNVEYLADAANFAMIEWMHPKHTRAHFQPTDSDGSIGYRLADGRVSFQPKSDHHAPDFDPVAAYKAEQAEAAASDPEPAPPSDSEPEPEFPSEPESEPEPDPRPRATRGRRKRDTHGDEETPEES